MRVPRAIFPFPLVVIPIFPSLPLLHSQVDYVDFLTVFFQLFYSTAVQVLPGGVGQFLLNIDIIRSQRHVKDTLDKLVLLNG